MECQFCTRKYNKQYNCQLCDKKFCSNICVLSHFSLDHSETNLKNTNSTVRNLLNEKLQEKILNNNTQIKSQYITKGNYNEGEIKYDQKYQLKNFYKLTTKGKDIILGAGTFGQIFLAQNRIDNKYYAIKHMDKKKLNQCLHNLNPIYNEIDIHSRIKHENIINVKFVLETKKTFDIVLEYANTGSLFHHIRKKKGFDEKNAFMYFIQVCNAIYFLHKNNLIHRDIKPENILLEDWKKVKLCDFGWCVEISSKQRSTYCGTTEYMAPEIINSNNYDKSIDIWSLGILLYELIHGFSPFRATVQKYNDNEVMNNIKKHNIKFYKDVSLECKELIFALLEKNSEKRLKIENVFLSKFVKKFEKENLFIPKDNLLYNGNNNNANNIKNIKNNFGNDNNNKKNIESKKSNSNYNTPKKNNSFNILYNIDNKINSNNNRNNILGSDNKDNSKNYFLKTEYEGKKENEDLNNLKMKILNEKVLQIERGKQFNFNSNNDPFENLINVSGSKINLSKEPIPNNLKDNFINEPKEDYETKFRNKIEDLKKQLNEDTIINNIFKENTNQNNNQFINIIDNSIDKNNEEEDNECNEDIDEEIDEFMNTPVKNISDGNNICPIMLINDSKKNNDKKISNY